MSAREEQNFDETSTASEACGRYYRPLFRTSRPGVPTGRGGFDIPRDHRYPPLFQLCPSHLPPRAPEDATRGNSKEKGRIPVVVMEAIAGSDADSVPGKIPVDTRGGGRC